MNIKCHRISLILLTAISFFSSCTVFATESRPNVVVILADDLGLGDISFYVQTIQNKTPVVETPTLDSLASNSLWFTDGHSATSLCAPTRYAVMSGNNNYRSTLRGVSGVLLEKLLLKQDMQRLELSPVTLATKLDLLASGT